MKSKVNTSTIKLIGIIVVAIMAVVFLFMCIANGPKNHAIDLEESINAAKADITIVEKKRNELLPTLADCVKQYDKHEYETLMSIIEARNSKGKATDETINEVNEIINVVAEAYPELKSNEQYKTLMESIELNENNIARYRENYNNLVEKYKSYVRKFPNSMLLSITGYDVIKFETLSYEVEDSMPKLFN